MDSTLIFSVKAILITEALTHAVRSWGILDPIRTRITARFDFMQRLLACFECSATWIALATFLYLSFLEFWPFTCIIITARLASVLNIAIVWLDALRASTITKI